jgi:hypothetical protein
MAPEQYTGGTVDRRADLFAAGVVMYQLLTGTHAFSGTTEQVAYKICHEHPPLPSEADPGRGWERYDAVVARALAKQPDERFATADAFRAAILEVYAAQVSPTVSEETIIAEPAVIPPLEPAGGAPARPEGERQTDGDTVILDRGEAAGGTVIGHRRKWAIPVAAIAVLAVAVVGVLLFSRTPGAPSPAKASAAAKAPAPPRTKAEAPKTEPRPVAIAKAPASPPAKVDAPRAEGRSSTVAKASAPPPAKTEAPKPESRPAAQSSPTAAARPATRPQASPATVAKPEPPPRKAATPPPAKPAAKEPERKVAAAGAEPAASGGGFWSDQGITLRIQSRLQFSRMWDSNSGIVVAVRNGVVTLTGTVPEQGDIAEAGRIAAGVAGVKGVRNELKVGPAK